MMDMRTSLSKAQGQGAAKKGIVSYIVLRVSSIGLIILTPIIVWCLLYYAGEGQMGLTYWLSRPLGAGLMILFLTANFYHMKLGLDEVIHDYLHKAITKYACLILNLFICIWFWLIGVLSVLIIIFKGY